MSNPTTVFYAWKRKVRESSGEERYMVPMGNPHLHEFPYDPLFDTIDEAREHLRHDIDSGFFDEDGPGAGERPSDWVLVKITEEPVD